jgi:cell shape-determining protein MreC
MDRAILRITFRRTLNATEQFMLTLICHLPSDVLPPPIDNPKFERITGHKMQAAPISQLKFIGEKMAELSGTRAELEEIKTKLAGYNDHTVKAKFLKKFQQPFELMEIVEQPQESEAPHA